MTTPQVKLISRSEMAVMLEGVSEEGRAQCMSGAVLRGPRGSFQIDPAELAPTTSTTTTEPTADEDARRATLAKQLGAALGDKRPRHALVETFALDVPKPEHAAS